MRSELVILLLLVVGVQSVDVDCTMSGWSPWSPCTVQCGNATGTTDRFRSVLIAPQGNGLPCPHLTESLNCTATVSCTIPTTGNITTNCTMSGWSPWTACIGNCTTGQGNTSRFRNVIIPGNPIPCPDTFELSNCSTVPPCQNGSSVLDSNCSVSGWAAWTSCDAVCPTNNTVATTANGNQTRFRNIIFLPQGNGLPCPTNLAEERTCIETCPAVGTTPIGVDCVTSGWSPWSSCNATCGGNGTQARFRSIYTPASNGGIACPNATGLVEYIDCNSTCIPTPMPTPAPLGNCTISGWSPWSACNSSCGPGWTFRTRTIVNNPNISRPCNVSLSEEINCTNPACTPTPVAPPVTCNYTGWSPWSTCNATCGVNTTGWQQRTRTIWLQPVNMTCNGSLIESIQCNGSACAPTPIPTTGGCVMTGWSAWSGCRTGVCGPTNDTETRTRSIYSATNVSTCPSTVEVNNCTYPNCTAAPVTVVACPGYFGWSPWSICNATCNTTGGGGVALGVQTRTRSLVCPSCPASANCTDPLTENFNCNTTCAAVDVDCVMGNFSAWGPCSIPCCDPSTTGGVCVSGIQRRSRSIATAQQGTGAPCGSLEEWQPCGNQTCPPINCIVGNWTAWSDCDQTCGPYGNRYRSRPVLQAPRFNGTACGNVSEVLACPLPNCTTPCSYTGWSGAEAPSNTTGFTNNSVIGWSPCTANCDGGWAIRQRRLISNGTAPNPPCEWCPTATDPSLTVVQRVAGVWMSWTDFNVPTWAPLDTSLGLTPYLVGNGSFCVQNVTCNAGTCPDIDCVVSPWTSWSACSQKCKYGRRDPANPSNGWLFGAPGIRSQTRYVISPASGNGTACPDLIVDEACNDFPCDVDCIPSAWSEYSSCSGTCWDPGPTPRPTKTRNRTIVVEKQFNGRDCGALVERVPCDVERCSQDCVLSDWSAWSQCTRVCDGGTRERTRDIILPKIIAGVVQPITACNAYLETEACNTIACRPGDCQVADWGPWGPCYDSTGTFEVLCASPGVPGGLTVRERTVIVAPTLTGLPCPILNETKVCNNQHCSADCVIGNWTDWGQCSVTCGGGVRTRRREGDIQPVNGGVDCPVPIEETMPCGQSTCNPDDCQVSAWGSWSICSAPCGGGIQFRERTIVRQATGNGQSCPVVKEWRICDAQLCKQDCEIGGWSDWTLCSTTCGGGNQESLSYVIQQPQGGGQSCPSVKRERGCNDNPCQVGMCVVANWSPWTTCSRDCEGGTQTRTRTITSQPVSPEVCPPLEEIRACNVFECSQDCVTSDWTGWDVCSHICGGGMQRRWKHILRNSSGSGQPCPILFEIRQCDTHQCVDGDCTLSEFTDWGTCSKPCGSGLQSRTRSVITQPVGPTAAPCPPELETYRDCNVHVCPTNCELSAWTNWTQCSKVCGGGVQIRKRWITKFPIGGQDCSHTEEHRQCNTELCVDSMCTVSAWSEWSPCPTDCGGVLIRATQERTRTTISRGTDGNCPLLSETIICNGQPCAADCIMSAWLEWSQCSATCGGGTQIRKRWAVQTRSGQGRICPAWSERRLCSEQPCRAGDCLAQPWSTWSECSASCDSGIQMRTRQLPVDGSCSGYADTDSSRCNLHSCSSTIPGTPGDGGSILQSVSTLKPPGTVALCANIILDGSLSLVRSGDDIVWITRSTVPELKAILDSNAGRLVTSPIDLTQVLSGTPGTYDVCLRVGPSTPSCQTLNVQQSTHQLITYVEGGTSRTVFSSDSVHLHVYAEWKRCDGQELSAFDSIFLSFKWGGLSEPIRLALERARSLSYPSLHIPGGILPPGTHDINCIVCPDGDSLCKTVSVRVRVMLPNLEPITTGNKTVLQGQPVVLDGSRSIDPSTNSVGEVIYRWTCSTLITRCPAGFPTEYQTSPSYTVSDLPMGELLFYLEMKRGDRSAVSAPMKITVLDPSQNLIPIGIGTNLQDPTEVDHTKKFGLWAVTNQVAGADQTQYDWGFAGVGSIPTQDGKYVVIPANSLLPGSTYTFTLKAVQSINSFGESSITLTTSPVANQGICRVSPTSGLSRSTSFTISCEGFSCPRSVNPPSYRFYANDQSLGAGFHDHPILSNVILNGDGTVTVKAEIKCSESGPSTWYDSGISIALQRNAGDASTDDILRNKLYSAVTQGRMHSSLRFLKLAASPGLEGAFDAQNITETFLSLRQDVNTGPESEDMLSTAAALSRRFEAVSDTTVSQVVLQTAHYIATVKSSKDMTIPLSSLQQTVGIIESSRVKGTLRALGLNPTVRSVVKSIQDILVRDAIPGEQSGVIEGQEMGVAIMKVLKASNNVDLNAVSVLGGGVSIPFGFVNSVTDGYTVRMSVWKDHPYDYQVDADIASWVVSVDVSDIESDQITITDFNERFLRVSIPVSSDSILPISLPAEAASVYFDTRTALWKTDGTTAVDIRVDNETTGKVIRIDTSHTTDFAAKAANITSVTTPSPPSSDDQNLVWIIIVVGIVLCCCFIAAFILYRRYKQKEEKKKQYQPTNSVEQSNSNSSSGIQFEVDKSQTQNPINSEFPFHQNGNRSVNYDEPVSSQRLPENTQIIHVGDV